jgi:hypothetical protein
MTALEQAIATLRESEAAFDAATDAQLAAGVRMHEDRAHVRELRRRVAEMEAHHE